MCCPSRPRKRSGPCKFTSRNDRRRMGGGQRASPRSVHEPSSRELRLKFDSAAFACNNSPACLTNSQANGCYIWEAGARAKLQNNPTLTTARTHKPEAAPRHAHMHEASCGIT
eukprot:396142-Pelagomonas_calceolata.AAC.7